MAGPVIKIYKVPANFAGINNILHKQSTTSPDIVQGSSALLPIEEAVDPTNTGNPGLYEGDPVYKIELTNKTANDYYPEQSGIGGKEWFVDHIGYEPRIWIKRGATYYNGEVWEYDYIPRLNEDGEENYELLASGIRFTPTFLAAEPAALNNDVYATFFYWEDENYVHPSGSNVRGYLASQYDDYVEFAPYVVTASGIGDVTASGEFFPDNGIFRWAARPSGTQASIAGYYHTWQRLTNDDLHDLRFNPGEEVPAQISDAPYLVKDFTESGPWYQWTDIKIVNESPNASLEKFFLQPVLRGKLNPQGYIYEGWTGYVDPTRPWDTHEGQALETVGYEGLFANTGQTFAALMWEQNYCWASGINPSGLLPGVSGLEADNHYQSDFKFPAVCSGVNVPTILTYYRSTRQTPDSRYAFAYSRDVVSGVNHENWLSQHPSGAQYKILQPGAIANDGFPVPDSVYVRCLYTLRNFDYVETQNFPSNPYNYSQWSSSPQFQTVQESDGIKAWTVEVVGTYYE